MTRMQRLQPWLMSGIAFFTLSVGLVGLQLNLGRNASSSGPMDFLSRVNLALYAYGLIVLGSFLILSGCLVEIAIPALRWCVGWRGRLYRRLGRKIEDGRELAARNPEISFDEQKQWASTAKGILAKDLGGWSPEIGALEDGGDRERNPFGRGNLTPKEVVARQIKVLQQIQAGLYDPSASVRPELL